MNRWILFIFLLTSLPRLEACPETDKNLDLYRVFVEVGLFKTIENDVDAEDDEGSANVRFNIQEDPNSLQV